MLKTGFVCCLLMKVWFLQAIFNKRCGNCATGLHLVQQRSNIKNIMLIGCLSCYGIESFMILEDNLKKNIFNLVIYETLELLFYREKENRSIIILMDILKQMPLSTYGNI